MCRAAPPQSPCGLSRRGPPPRRARGVLRTRYFSRMTARPIPPVPGGGRGERTCGSRPVMRHNECRASSSWRLSAPNAFGATLSPLPNGIAAAHVRPAPPSGPLFLCASGPDEPQQPACDGPRDGYRARGNRVPGRRAGRRSWGRVARRGRRRRRRGGVGARRRWVTGEAVVVAGRVAAVPVAVPTRGGVGTPDQQGSYTECAEDAPQLIAELTP
jgi:hypothetical protein